MKICIDFQGGAHGNFLEFVCNIVAGVKASSTPFNKLGASHNKNYRTNKIFYAGHYSFAPQKLISNKVVAIKLVTDDLLPLSQISLLRAGDYGYDNDELEVNTYHKLNNIHYRWVLDTIVDSFFTNQVRDSYNAVKDSSWPDITTIDEFKNLPENIKTECIDVHNLKLFELNEIYPDCPREVLREFFEHGFLTPASHGFMVEQSKMVYPDAVDVYEFPFHAFYNTTLFVDQLKQIACWTNIVYNSWDEVADLHRGFLELQPYANSKNKCDAIVNDIINGKPTPEVNLIEESYINAQLTKKNYERRY